MTIKISIVGTSWISDKFCEAINDNPHFQLWCIYSRKKETADNFAKKHQAKLTTTSLEELFSNGTQALYIASPNVCHFEQCLNALNHQIHVICEKPLVVNSSQYQILMEAAQKNKVVLMHAYKCIYFDNFQKILLNYQKYLGNVKMALLQFGKVSSKWESFQKGVLENIFNPKMEAGSMNDLGIYCILLSIHLFGKINWKSPILRSSENHENGIDLNSFMQYTHITGERILIQAAKNINIHNYSEIVGEKGSFLIKDISRLNQIIFVDNNNVSHDLTLQVAKNDLAPELENFYLYITQQKNYLEYHEINLEAIKLLEYFQSK